MLLSAPPLLHRPPRNALPTTYTGRSRCWSSTRTAAPPRSGPRRSHRLPTNAGVDDLEPAAAHEDRAAPAAVVPLPGGVAVRERQVLHHQPRGGLVVAVRRRPVLLRVAGVLVEDPALAAAVERHQAAAVEHHPARLVDDLRGLPHPDRHRLGPAVEGDHAAPARPPGPRPRTCSSPACPGPTTRSGCEVSTARPSRGTGTGCAPRLGGVRRRRGSRARPGRGARADEDASVIAATRRRSNAEGPTTRGVIGAVRLVDSRQFW